MWYLSFCCSYAPFYSASLLLTSVSGEPSLILAGEIASIYIYQSCNSHLTLLHLYLSGSKSSSKKKTTSFLLTSEPSFFLSHPPSPPSPQFHHFHSLKLCHHICDPATNIFVFSNLTFPITAILVQILDTTLTPIESTILLHHSLYISHL